MNAPEGVLPCLDELEGILQQRARLLRRLRECVRDNDLAGLAELLRRDAPVGGAAETIERRVRDIRERIAAAAGVPSRELSLARLAGSLDGPAAIALNDRRERLRMTVGLLQQEADATVRLVRHALEYSSRLLAMLLGVEDDGTYSAEGEVELPCRSATFEHSV